MKQLRPLLLPVALAALAVFGVATRHANYVRARLEYASAALTGSTPGTAVPVLDALGRVAATATVGAGGTAALGGQAPGLYLVRVGTGSVRLAVE